MVRPGCVRLEKPDLKHAKTSIAKSWLCDSVIPSSKILQVFLTPDPSARSKALRACDVGGPSLLLAFLELSLQEIFGKLVVPYTLLTNQ